MLDLLATFAALSMAGTVLLSLLPNGSIKRTASLAVGLLSILCWAEGIAGLLGISFSTQPPDAVLVHTSWNMDTAITQTNTMIADQWEVLP